jgi:hypothetical protein
MKRSTLSRKISLLFLGALLMTCANDSGIMNVSGEWVSGIPFILNHVDLEIPHDDRIYETTNFLVFSDASSDDIKIDFAEKAEKALREVMYAFDIKNPAELGICDQSSKITIYTEKIPRHSQLSFPYGFLLHGKDSEIYYHWPPELKARFYKEVKHETVHVVQFLLGVLPNPEHREREPDRWFNEGLAETLSGGFFIPITTKAEFEEWKRIQGHVNPISIHRWSDLPIPASRVGEYYPMFGVAVRYLIDPDGLGTSLADVKEMLITLSGNDTDFVTAFEKHFGIGLEDYEKTFFDRVDAYLK